MRYQLFSFLRLVLAVLILLLMCSTASVSAQCPSSPTVGANTGTNLVNMANANSGNYRFSGINTYSWISVNGCDTIRIYAGILTLSAMYLYTTGGLIQIHPGATLIINGGGKLNVPDNIQFENYGTLTFNCDIDLAGNNVYLYTHTGATTTINGDLHISHAGSLVCGVSPTVTGSIYALPVELINFTVDAVDESVLLRWETATETDNDYFVVERSGDGIDFIPVAEVDGAGNSNAPLEYMWYDEEPILGVSYYRLKQLDHDGAYEYSDVVVVEYDMQDLVITPNPNNGLFALKGFIGEEYLITNSLGHMYTGLVPPSGIIEKNLNPGLYVLRIGCQHKKFIVH